MRVGGDDLQRGKGNVKLLGRNLLKRRLEALAEFGLAGEYGNAAITVDPDPGIEIGRRFQTAGRARRGSRSGRVLLLRQERP